MVALTVKSKRCFTRDPLNLEKHPPFRQFSSKLFEIFIYWILLFFQECHPTHLTATLVYSVGKSKSHAWPLVKAILIFFNMWFQGYLCQPKLLQYANQNIWSQQDCNHGYKDPKEFNPVYKLNYNADGSQLCANAKVHTYLY